MHSLCEILGLCNVQKYYIVYLSDDFRENIGTVEVNGDTNENDNSSPCFSVNTHPNAISFHENLKITPVSSIQEVSKYYTENINCLKSMYGILLFLYSVIATRVSL